MQTDPKTLLRDVMSTERTSLANKRTFMAAIRTALALAATGAAFIKFLDDDFIKVLGWLLIAGGLLVQVIGSINYFRVRQVVLHARHTVDPNNELPDHIESSKKQRRGKQPFFIPAPLSRSTSQDHARTRCYTHVMINRRKSWRHGRGAKA